MIVVTGATGPFSAQTVEQLLRRLPAAEIAVSVRDVARAQSLAERGVRVRHGDFADPASLRAAFEGADQVLVVSTDSIGADAVARHAAAFEAARDVGAARILYTSHQAAAPDSLVAFAPDHAASEAALRATGPTFTSLRNGFYAGTVPHLIGQALTTGELVAPMDGPVSWTARDDLAEAAAVVLTTPGLIDGISPPLTAPQLWDLDGVAGLLSDLTGKPVRRVLVDDDEYVSRQVAAGVPAPAAQFLLGMFRAARRGEFAVADQTLEELLGRSATPLRAVLADALGG